MKPGLLGGMAVLAAALGFAGCGEKSGTDGKNASGAGNPITAPVDYLGAVGAAQKQAQRVADLTPVQQAVQAFQAGEDRLPATLQELVSEGYLARLPTPPRGAQLAYNPTTGQVKFVPAPVPGAGGTTPPPGR
jgi:hypothetical protein